MSRCAIPSRDWRRNGFSIEENSRQTEEFAMKNANQDLNRL
jgi:hypothetical protein